MWLLPAGELMASYPSPNGENVVNMYLCNGGATVDFAVRGEVVYQSGRKKNIYWQYHEQDAWVVWWGSDTVTINFQMLDIHRDVYDYRKER